MAEGAGAVQFLMTEFEALAVVAVEAIAEGAEVVEMFEDEPGTVACFIADEGAGVGDAAPDEDLAVEGGVDGDNAGGGVPALDPFFAEGGGDGGGGIWGGRRFGRHGAGGVMRGWGRG